MSGNRGRGNYIGTDATYWGDRSTNKWYGIWKGATLWKAWCWLVQTYNRMTIYDLSKHMGTSVKMIEVHYGHVQLRKKAHAIAGGKQRVQRETARQKIDDDYGGWEIGLI